MTLLDRQALAADQLRREGAQVRPSVSHAESGSSRIGSEACSELSFKPEKYLTPLNQCEFVGAAGLLPRG
jgi:hypothetical protein